MYSFCIYGTNLKYHKGLLRNIQELLSLKNNNNSIVIYKSQDIVLLPEILELQDIEKERIIVREIEENGNNRFMIYRLFAFDEFQDSFDYIFIRDADSSVVSGRDLWCIEEFMNHPEFDFHTIRDHHYHYSCKYMVGLLGFQVNKKTRKYFHFKQEFENNFSQKNEDRYMLDVDFVKCYLDKQIKYFKFMIHSSAYTENDIFVYPILKPLNKQGTDFAGNVLNERQEPQFKFHAPYTFTANPVNVEAKEIESEKIESEKIESEKIESKEIETVSRKVYEIQDVYKSNEEIKAMKKIVVGTTYKNRIPNDDEFVIVYGNYCLDDNNVPTDNSPNKVYRNAYFYLQDKKDLAFDRFEYDPVWEPLGIIYIMNVENREDRMVLTLIELAKLHIPFDRIHHYIGKIDKSVHKYIAATRNHAECVADFMMSGKDYALFLEDDITVIDSPEEQIQKFKTFFERKYDFDVCLLATSRHFSIKPYDDLLSLSYQQCTTSSAYLLSSKTADKVYECFDTGISKMIETGNTHDYCVDRYWCKLQANNKFFVFKNKIMYQSCTWSSLQQKPVMQFD